MVVRARSHVAGPPGRRRRVISRPSRRALLAGALLALGSVRTVAGAPPEELRIGLLGDRGVTFRGEKPWAVDEYLAAAGDVDDDGLADFLLTRVNPEADYEREILLVRGSREPWPPAPSMAEVRARSIVLRRTGPAEAIRGRGVDAAGDIDRDGFDDIFVLRPFGAAPGWGGDTGTPGVVHLIHGAPDLPPEISLDEPPAGVRMALFTSTKVTSTHLALDVATGGDLNGDRVPDLVFGAGFSESENPTTQYGTGRAYVLFGGPPLEGTIDVEEVGMSRPGFILEGEADGEWLGRVVEFSGDVNGDGVDDLLTGGRAAYGRDPGFVNLVWGGTTFPRLLPASRMLADGYGVRFVGAGAAADAGETLAALGDLNSDGFADFLVGSPGAEGQKGAVYLVYGRRHFPETVKLEDLVSLGMGAKLRGTHPRPPLPGAPVPTEEGAAGRALDLIRWDADGVPDFLIGSPDLEVGGVGGVGRVSIVLGSAFAPGTYSLGGIDAGDLPGSIVTWERKGGLGATAAALGDHDGDGHEDFLVSAPFRFQDEEIPEVHLILGRPDGADPLGLESVAPSVAPVAGGTEARVVGRGFDDATEVLVGGRPTTVLRVDTSARLSIRVPAADSPGPADLEVRRDGGAATLPGAIRYARTVPPDIDLRQPPMAGVATRLLGLQSAPCLVDLDGDGLADIVTSLPQVAGLCVTWGRPSPPAALDLPPAVRGAGGAEGFSLIWGEEGPTSLAPVPAGDVDGDGTSDLAILSESSVTVVFGGARLPTEAWLEDLLADALGARIIWMDTEFCCARVAGGGDLDGDGVGDLLVRRRDDLFGMKGTVRIARGARRWPREQVLEDLPRLVSGVADDAFGDSIAIARDVDGDGRDELLVGAPGQFWRDDGNGYLVRGGLPLASERIEDLVAAGSAARFDAFKARDSIGTDVCALGDFDGDGVPDFALSAEGGGFEFAGESYVVFGGPALLAGGGANVLSMRDLGSRGVRIPGDVGYDYSNWIEPAGDFNGDGLEDLLISSSDTRSSPEVHVVFGGPARTVALRAFEGEGARILVPSPSYDDMAGGGDFDGDGLDDVVVAGTRTQGGMQSVYIVFGSTGELEFVRGDASGDGEVVISDAIFALGYLFLGGEAPSCDDAADANDDGTLEITDAIYILAHLFLGGPPPPLPYPGAGADPTADALGCGGP